MAQRDLGQTALAGAAFEESVLATPADRARSLYLHRAYLFQSQVEMGAWRDAEVSLDTIQPLAVDVASTRTDDLLRGVLADLQGPRDRGPRPPVFIEERIARLSSTLGCG